MEKMKIIKPKTLIILSVIAAILSVVQSLTGMELYLAGTQWMLLAIIFGAYAIYVKRG